MKIGQTLLDYLFDLILSDETKVLSTGNSHYLSVALGVFILAETDKGSRLGIDALNSLSSLADDESNESHRYFELYLMRAVDGTAVHLPLSLHDEVQFLSYPLDRLGVALHEDVSCLSSRSIGCCTCTFRGPDFLAMLLVVRA